MNRPILLMLIAATSLLPFTKTADGQATTQGSLATTRNSPSADEAKAEVDRLFESMRAGRYAQGADGRTTAMRAPSLAWQHIPALLELADSKMMLASFPVNPLSSQVQFQCSEGMMALWLIEGIRLSRTNGQFPSLNPICLPKDTHSTNWQETSEANHSVVAAAYRAWWKQVATGTAEQARQINPLEGLGMAWH